MRKSILPILLMLCFTVRAQITPVHTISGPVTSNPLVIHLTQYGDKYVEVRGLYNEGFNAVIHHPAPDTILIFNMDFSLFRRIILPDTACAYIGLNSSYYESAIGPGLYGESGGIPSITDNLFNTDSLIEYAVLYRSDFSLKIFNENGTTIFSSPNPTGTSSNFPGLLKMNNSYYLYADSTIYSLPGSLPCSQCNSFPAGIIEPKNDNIAAGLNAYPNPFNNMLTLEYYLSGSLDNAKITITDILGREIQSIKLTSQSDKILLTTGNLPKGTLIVSLFNNTSDPISRKVIKID